MRLTDFLFVYKYIPHCQRSHKARTYNPCYNVREALRPQGNTMSMWTYGKILNIARNI